MYVGLCVVCYACVELWQIGCSPVSWLIYDVQHSYDSYSSTLTAMRYLICKKRVGVGVVVNTAKILPGLLLFFELHWQLGREWEIRKRQNMTTTTLL